MRVPHTIRIGGLVLATTAFYGYVGQMVPQKEVQPPEEVVLSTDLTTADMVTRRPRDHGRQGTLLHLPHDRQDGGTALSRPRGNRCTC